MCAVAENRLVYPALAARVTAAAAEAPLPPSSGGYFDMAGTEPFRAAFLSALGSARALRAVLDPARLVLMSGCGAVISATLWSLCDPGDAVIVPAPYYPAWDSDCTLVAGAVIFPARMTAEDGYVVTLDALEGAADAAAAAGRRVRAVLLTNPGNPVGTIHSPRRLREIAGWCGRRGIQLIVDEIYACCVHGGAAGGAGEQLGARSASAAAVVEPREASEGRTASGGVPAAAVSTAAAEAVVIAAAPGGHDDGASAPSRDGDASTFTSVVDALGNGDGSDAGLGEHVHVMWGLSKDWGASGYRVGGLYTRCAELRSALSGLAYFHGVSGLTAELLTRVLRDGPFVAGHMAAGAAALRSAGATARAALEGIAGVPCAPSPAGMFLWADMRGWLREGEHGWDGEAALATRLFEVCRVVFTPGSACHAAAPGYFRVCFAWGSPAAVRAAAERIRDRLGYGGGARNVPM